MVTFSLKLTSKWDKHKENKVKNEIRRHKMGKEGNTNWKKKITSFKTNLVAIYIYKNVKFWRFNFSNFLKSVSGAQKWIHPAELRWNQADNALGCEMVALLAGKSCLLRNSIYMACTIQPSKEGRCSGNKVPGIMSRCLVMPTFFFFCLTQLCCPGEIRKNSIHMGLSGKVCTWHPSLSSLKPFH